MKKVLLIGLIVAFALIIVGGAGVAYARIRGADNIAALTIARYNDSDEVVRQFSYGPGGMMGQNWGESCPGGMMGGYSDGSCPGFNGNYGPGGMMGKRGNAPGMMGRGGFGVARGEGLMHDYMIAAFAEAVDLTPAEVETRLEGGERMVEIATAQGITEEALPDLLTQVRTSALSAAVADGVITQAQADLMLEHMNNYQGQGFGRGFKQGFDGCPMLDGDDE
jgi:hypothetical protein